MTNLEGLLSAEYDSLQTKMYMCKTIHFRYSMTDAHKSFLLRQSVLGVYAAWEGFVKKSISIYLQEINKCNLSYADLNESYLSYQTDNVVKFKSPKTEQSTIDKLSKSLYQMYLGSVFFNTSVNTESNANLKVANNILNKLQLKKIDIIYEHGLNKLLRFRNSIAHGDEGIPVAQTDLDEFTILVQDLASALITSIVDGFDRKVYAAPGSRTSCL